MPPSTLAADLGTLRDDSAFADVTFILSDSSQLSAHRNILSARSGYFNRVFSGQGGGGHSLATGRGVHFEWGGSGADRVTCIVDDSTSAGMQALLEYLYSDSVEGLRATESPELQAEVASLAERFDLPRLRVMAGALAKG
jgi:hypothetical protein